MCWLLGTELAAGCWYNIYLFGYLFFLTGLHWMLVHLLRGVGQFKLRSYLWDRSELRGLVSFNLTAFKKCNR